MHKVPIPGWATSPDAFATAIRALETQTLFEMSAILRQMASLVLLELQSRLECIEGEMPLD